MPNNVIELIFKLKDQVTAPLKALKGRIGGALNFGLAVGGIASVGAIFAKTVHATREAEDALVSFNQAYTNLGKNVGITREAMRQFADQAATRTIFDDETILKAQATLLKFKAVSGDTFTRAR